MGVDSFPCVQRVPWSFDLRGQKSTRSGRSPVSRRSHTAMGWKNANLRSEMSRLLRLAGVSILATIVPFDAGELANGTATRVSRCMWFARGLATHLASHSRVTWW